MDKPVKAKTRQILVNLPPATFPTVLFANKIGIESVGLETLVHFGCLSESVGALAFFAVFFDRAAINHQRKSWGEYLAKLGSLEATVDLSFRCVSARINSVPMTNMALWGRNGDDAELRLFSISMGDILEASKSSSESVTAQPLALIRCPLDLQKQLLAELLK